MNHKRPCNIDSLFYLSWQAISAIQVPLRNKVDVLFLSLGSKSKKKPIKKQSGEINFIFVWTTLNLQYSALTISWLDPGSPPSAGVM